MSTTAFDLDAAIASAGEQLRQAEEEAKRQRATELAERTRQTIDSFRALLDVALPRAIQDALAMTVTADPNGTLAMARFKVEGEEWTVQHHHGRQGDYWQITRPYFERSGLPYQAPAGQLGDMLLANLAAAREQHAAAARKQAEEAECDAALIAAAEAEHERFTALVNAAEAEAKAARWQWPVIDGEPILLALYAIRWQTGASGGEEGGYIEYDDGWLLTPGKTGSFYAVYRYGETPRLLLLGPEHLPVIEAHAYRYTEQLPAELWRNVYCWIPDVAWSQAAPDGKTRYAVCEGAHFRIDIGEEPQPWIKAELAALAEAAAVAAQP